MADKKKKKKRQQQRRRQDRTGSINAIDASSAIWQPYIAEMVEVFNGLPVAAMPDLVYQQGRHTQTLEDLEFVSIPTMEHAGTWGGGNIITLNDTYGQTLSPEGRRQVVCHEMMHAMAQVGDCYDCNPLSCIYGQLTYPGPADIQMLWDRYRKK